MLKLRRTSERLECRRNNIKTQINQTSSFWFLNVSDGRRASPSRRRVGMRRNEYLMYGRSCVEGTPRHIWFCNRLKSQRWAESSEAVEKQRKHPTGNSNNA